MSGISSSSLDIRIAAFREQIRSEIQSGLRALFETRHLFQNLQIPCETIKANIAALKPTDAKPRVQSGNQVFAMSNMAELRAWQSRYDHWTSADRELSILKLPWTWVVEGTKDNTSSLILPTVLVGCANPKCDGDTPYPHNPWTSPQTPSPVIEHLRLPEQQSTVQVWTFALSMPSMQRRTCVLDGPT